MFYHPSCPTTPPIRTAQGAASPSPRFSLALMANVRLNMNTRAIFKDWERLRIIYNLILLVVFILMSAEAYYFREIGAPQSSFYSTLFHAIVYAFIANTLYFAGPALDAYLSWLDIRFKYKRQIIFISGTLLSVAIEIVILSLEFTPF